MWSVYRVLRLTPALLVCAGCLNPWHTRMPTFRTQSPESERRESEYHDPFPDSQIGPETGFRPEDYHQQRPLPVRTRQRFDVSRFRQQLMTPPPVSPPPGSEYPQVVPF